MTFDTHKETKGRSRGSLPPRGADDVCRRPGGALKFVETLKSSGLPQQQAKAVVRVFSEAQQSAELATKNDLKLAIAELRADLIKWMGSGR